MHRGFPQLLKFLFLMLAVVGAAATALSEDLYKKPSPQVSKIVDSESFPSISINVAKTHALKGYYNALPPIDFIAAKKLKLAGLRFLPSNRSKFRSYFFTRIEVLDLKTKKSQKFHFPKNSRLGFPKWSVNSRHFVVTVFKPNCAELWRGDIRTRRVDKIPGVCLNDIMGSPLRWVDADHILARTVYHKGQPKKEHYVAKGPLISESSGKVSQNRTYQDLLKNQADEKLFEFYTTSQLVVIDLRSKKVRRLGSPGIFQSFSVSPNAKLIRVQKILKPYSYVVRYNRFASTIELWNLKGRRIHTLSRRSKEESIPIHGVRQGPRSYQWVPEKPSLLMYASALDKGDWKVKVPYRDQVFLQEIRGEKVLPPKKFYKTTHRYSGTDWLNGEESFILYDYERDRKWVRGLKANLQTTREGDKLEPLWSYSYRDAYGRPGSTVNTLNKYNRSVIDVVKDKDGRWFFTYDKGATPKGDFPYLKKVSFDGKKEIELFRSEDGFYESFVTFSDKNHTGIITKRESADIAPDLYLRNLKKGTLVRITREKNPADILAKVKKELLTWKRKDGVLMSGVLYYPLGYKKGTKYPTVVSAYPIEYADKNVAGQVRGSSNRYSKPWRASYLYLTLNGYALLKDAQMPVVGHPKTMNDSLIEQLKMNASSIKTVLKKTGVSDPNRLGVIGHSYGAFMVANLLSHSEVFKTGVARSGAYNRTLTPFGFQSERRPFWEAKETYLKVSPFMSAEKMKKPLLLLHGAIDSNSGTHTMQSERYFAALKGNGAKARLVLLPHESHGYSAKESVNHVLWETQRWFDLHLK